MRDIHRVIALMALICLFLLVVAYATCAEVWNARP